MKRLIPNPNNLTITIHGRTYAGTDGVVYEDIPNGDAYILMANGWEEAPALAALYAVTAEAIGEHAEQHRRMGLAVPKSPTGDALPVVVPDNFAGVIIQSPLVQANLVANAVTYGAQHFAEANFYAARFTVRNYGNSALPINAARAAPADIHLHNGANLAWSNITFNNGNLTANIPAGLNAANNSVPGLLTSDWIYMKARARTDTEAYKPLLQTRFYLAGNATVQQEVSANRPLSGWNNISNGRQIGAWSQSGDQVSANAAKVMAESGAYFSAGVEVEFLYTQKVYSGIFVGDSLFKGANSSGFVASCCARMAMKLSDTYGIPFSAAVYAMSGQTTTATLAVLKAIFAAGKRPKVVCFKNWSPNDTTASDTIMDTAWATMLEEVALCQQYGALPVVFTSPPVGSTTSNARRVAHNQRTLTELSGAVVVDLDGMEDPTNPGHLLPTYDGSDDLHWSDTGHDFVADLGAQKVAPCLSVQV